MTPKPVKKALKVAHPVSTLETAAADAVNRPKAKSSKPKQGRPAKEGSRKLAKRTTQTGFAAVERDLPEAIDKLAFMAWEGHRVRLAAALENSASRADRYRDLVVIVNVMAGQYEVVREQSAAFRKLEPGALRSAGFEPFRDWAEPWLDAYESETAACESERDRLRKSLPRSERRATEDEAVATVLEIQQRIAAQE